MTPEELLKLAREVIAAGAGLSAGALAEGYLALSATLQEKDEMIFDLLVRLGESPKEMGRRGGLKGGVARANSMTAEERTESALKAARARWGKHP